MTRFHPGFISIAFVPEDAPKSSSGYFGACGFTISLSREPKSAIAGVPPFLQFAFLLAISVAVGWQPLLRTFPLALHADEYNHLLLILPISASLILTERARLKSALEPGTGFGAPILFVAVLTACYSRWMTALHGDIQLSISMLAMVIWWSRIFCFLLWRSGGAAVLVCPLFFCFWLVSHSCAAINQIFSGNTDPQPLPACLLLLSAFGIPVTQDGIVLSIPDSPSKRSRRVRQPAIEPDVDCHQHGAGPLFLRSFWRKTAVVVAAIPLSIAKNGLRIFSIAMLGTRVDPGYLHGDLHRKN